MNAHARKKARRAELEDYLLEAYNRLRASGEPFADFLMVMSTVSILQREAKELIALYESEPTGEREGM